MLGNSNIATIHLGIASIAPTHDKDRSPWFSEATNELGWYVWNMLKGPNFQIVLRIPLKIRLLEDSQPKTKHYLQFLKSWPGDINKILKRNVVRTKDCTL